MGFSFPWLQYSKEFKLPSCILPFLHLFWVLSLKQPQQNRIMNQNIGKGQGIFSLHSRFILCGVLEIYVSIMSFPKDLILSPLSHRSFNLPVLHRLQIHRTWQGWQCDIPSSKRNLDCKSIHSNKKGLLPQIILQNSASRDKEMLVFPKVPPGSI